MADVPGKFFSATKVRTGVAPSSSGSLVGEPLPPVNPPGSSLNSVGLTMPSAFTVSNSPLTANGTIGVAGAGTVGQYIRGDGSLADFPQASGGGSSVSYYLNGSISQGTIGGVAYKELNKVPILGAGTQFSINADGYIASFLTDAGDPNLLEIPGGNWNFETYFSASSSGGTPTFYVELYKYDGTTFTLIASSSTSPELIAFGTNLNPYFSTLAVPTTTLALTDRLAVRFYVTHSGRTITMHTENNTLCQIVTTFTTGLTSLNGLTAQVQNLAVGTSGTDFNIASATATHTFNLPTASATNRGALSSSDWSLFTQAYNDKINSAAVTGTTTKTLTLTQQDGGTITASWSDLNTDAVLSVFGRTGAVVAANGDYTTAQVTESGNLYFTQARVSANTDVAANTAARHNAVTLGTANGLSLSTQQLSLALASGSTTGALSSTDWNTFNSKQNALTNPVTGTGTSGQVAYFTGTTTISSESNLFWDATNDRLGIGSSATPTPVAGVKFPLLVTSDAVTRIRIDSTQATPNAGVGLYANGVQKFSFAMFGTTSDFTIYNDALLSSSILVKGDTNNILINDNNDLGQKLRLGGRFALRASATASATTQVPVFVSDPSSTTTELLTRTPAQFRSDIGAQATLTNPVTGTGTTNYLPKFTGTSTIGNSQVFDNGTNVGIGTPSPNYLLHIAAGAANPQLQFTSTGTGSTTSDGFHIGVNNSTLNAFLLQKENADLEILTNDTQRMRITAAGRVLIGTPPPTESTFQLDVNGTGRFSGNLEIVKSSNPYLIINDSGVASTGGILFQPTGFNAKGGLTLNFATAEQRLFTGEGGNTYFQTFYTNGVERLRITSGGNLGLGVTPSAWSSSWRAFEFQAAAIAWTGAGANDFSFSTNSFFDATDSRWEYKGTGDGAARYSITALTSEHRWFNAPIGTAGAAISFTQAMTLGSNSGLSIGTPSAAPAQGLVVIGDSGIGTVTPDVFGRFYTRTLGLSSSGSTAIQINGGSGGYGQIDFGAAGVRTAGISASANETQWGSVTGIPAIIYTNGATRLTIHGTTGAATFSSSVTVNGTIPATSGKLSVLTSTSTLGATADLGLLISNDGANGKLAQIGFGYSESRTAAVIGGIISNGGGATTSDLFFATRSTTVGSDAPTERMRIFSGGNVGIGTSTYSMTAGYTGLGINNATNGGALDLLLNDVKKGELYITSTSFNMYGFAGVGLNLTVDNNSSKGLSIATTGAATFSSSVTAGGIIKSTNAGAGFRHYYNNGSGNIELSQRSDNKLQIYAWNGSAYTDILLGVDGAAVGGNVGIGTSSPSNILQITAAAGSSHARWTESATTVGFVGGAQGIITGHNGKFAVRAESGLVLSGSGNSADVVIASGGNVLIGTQDDNSNKLRVNGNVWVDAPTSGKVSIVNSSGVSTTIGVGATTGYVGTNSDHQLDFFTNNNVLATLKTDGQFEVQKIKTAGPTGGTAQPWRLGSVATVSPTSPNRTIEVEVNGTTYYLHAKTTNN